MALSNLKRDHLMPLHFKGLICVDAVNRIRSKEQYIQNGCLKSS